MKLSFEAYDALDELQPVQEWDVQSTFACNVNPYVLGVWVKNPNPDPNFPDLFQVIPLYLTREQLDQIPERSSNG